MQRTNNYKICQWNIVDPAEIAALAAKKSAVAAMSIPEATQSNGVPVPRPRPLINTETSAGIWAKSLCACRSVTRICLGKSVQHQHCRIIHISFVFSLG